MLMPVRGALKKNDRDSNMTTTAGRNSLIQNENSKVIFNTLRDVKVGHEKCLAWKMSKNQKITAEIEIDVIRKFNNEVVFKAKDEGQLEKLKLIISGSEKINIFLVSKGVLFQADFKVFDHENKLVLKFPQMIAQAERRKSLRLILDEKVDSSINFLKSYFDRDNKIQTQGFKKSCYDLSSGGLSFIINHKETKFFNTGEELSEINIKFDGLEHKVQGKIVNLIPVDPGPQNKLLYAGFRVCIEFNEIDGITKDLIDIFVFKHLDIETKAS